MSQFDCKNLTKAIRELATLKSWTDSALDKFNPTNGLLAREEVGKKLAEYELLLTYGNKLLKLFLDGSSGGIEVLKRRTVTLRIGGMQETNISEMLFKKYVRADHDGGWILDELENDPGLSRRQIHPEESTFMTISVRTLGFEDDARPDLVIQKAHEVGLELCPIETGPICMLEGTNKQFPYDYVVATKTVNPPEAPDYKMIFKFESGGLYDLLRDYYYGPALWTADQNVMFRVAKASNGKKS
jgi:hypothetical protein